MSPEIGDNGRDERFIRGYIIEFVISVNIMKSRTKLAQGLTIDSESLAIDKNP